MPSRRSNAAVPVGRPERASRGRKRRSGQYRDAFGATSQCPFVKQHRPAVQSRESRVRGEVSSALRQANVAVQRAIASGRLNPEKLREIQESYRAEGAAETKSHAD